MSDKYAGVYVTFDRQISEEYLEIVRSLIHSIKLVSSVDASPCDPDHHFAYCQAKHELTMKLLDLLK